MNRCLKFDALKYFCTWYVVLLNYQFTYDEVADEFKGQEKKSLFSKEEIIQDWIEFNNLNEAEKELYIAEITAYMYDDKTCTVQGLHKEDSVVDESDLLSCLIEIFKFM